MDIRSDDMSGSHAKELTLKDIFLKLRGLIAYLWENKLILILIGIIGAGLGLWYAFADKPKYKGEITFVLEDNRSSPLGAYAGIASQFGVDLGSMGGGSGAFDGDNILGLLKSRMLVEKALLTGTVNKQGENITLAELFIDFSRLREKWKKNPALQQIRYPSNADRKHFSLEQDSILNSIQRVIVDELLTVEKPDKKLSFISVSVLTQNEQFSKVFTEKLVDVALDFYIETKTQRNKANIDRLQQQADSLEQMLNKRTYSVAQVQDINANPAKQIATVGLELVQRDKMVLQTMYGEVIKNLELSKLAMSQETPIIQIIDVPVLPLEKKKFGKIRGIILGGLSAGGLCALILILRKIFFELMA